MGNKNIDTIGISGAMRKRNDPAMDAVILTAGACAWITNGHTDRRMDRSVLDHHHPHYEPDRVVAELRGDGLEVSIADENRRRRQPPSTPMTNPPKPRLLPRLTFLHRACLPISTNWTNVQALSGLSHRVRSPAHRAPTGVRSGIAM